MTLPKILQEQADHADQLMAQIIADKKTVASKPIIVDEQPGTPPLEQPAEPETLSDASQRTITSSDVGDLTHRLEQAEQRYKVLQGKYNAEIRDAKTTSNDAENEKLRQQVADLSAQLEAAKAPPPVSTNIEQLRADYGDELIDGVIEAAKERIMAEVSGQVNSVRDTVQRDSYATKTAILSQRLAASGIDFQTVNGDPVFHDWLSKYDPDTGVQRQSQLTQLFESGQIDQTAEMFREFMGVVVTKPSSNFEQHVQPRSTAPTAPVQPQQKQAFTNDQIADFYNACAKGNVYTSEEAAAIERQIFNSLR